jgi:hypothetical protein
VKYSDRDNLVAGLRELADWIEENGHRLPVREIEFKADTWVFDDWKDYNNPDKYLRPAREKMQQIARVLGRADKELMSDWFSLKKKFGDFVMLEFTSNRKVVCRKVVKGTRTIPEQVIPEHEEEIVEWECNDPLLK